MTYTVKDNCVKILILLSLTSLLFLLIMMNQVILYVHPRFIILLQISDVIFFLMLLAQCMHLKNSLNQNILRQEDSNIKSYHVEKEKYKLFFYYVTFIFSLAVTLFIPSTSLDSKLIENKGLNNTILDKARSGMSVPIDNFQDTKFIKISDKNYVDVIQNLYCHPADYIGKTVEITGFAYIDPASKRVSLTRYVISCCIADASAVGLSIDAGAENNLVDGHWYQMQGIISMISYKKDVFPVLKITWYNEIKKPLFTYIFVKTT